MTGRSTGEAAHRVRAVNPCKRHDRAGAQWDWSLLRACSDGHDECSHSCTMHLLPILLATNLAASSAPPTDLPALVLFRPPRWAVVLQGSYGGPVGLVGGGVEWSPGPSFEL